MIEIDGSWGEGGGQVLRTSLSLAAITGQPLRLTQIRAGRPKPGLAAQHLTAVRAVAEICQARVRGGELGAMELEFVPTCPLQPGNYTFDVSQAREGGSAGAVTLILQAVLLPLSLAAGNSRVTLRGGTHVPWSPPATYIEEVYLPLLAKLGLSSTLQIRSWGWYPRGGGEVELQVEGGSPWLGIQLGERGSVQQVRGWAVATELPSHIPQRMAMRAEKLLRDLHLTAKVQPLRERGIAPGTGIFLTAEYENSRAGFSALGRRGLAAEAVAELAVKDLLAFEASGAPVDRFLGDQILLPAALATEPSQYVTAQITPHLRTNAWAIEQFGLAEIEIDEKKQQVTVTPLSQQSI